MLVRYLAWFCRIFFPVLAILAPPTLLYLAYCRKHRRPIDRKRLPLDLALAGDLLMTLILTLLDRTEITYTQLHLFATWREAWNVRTSPALFAQLFLNIGVFVPFGALLTLRFPRLRRVWAAGLCALGLSAFIEGMQLLFSRGVCDVDDLFCNALGGMLGGAIVCLVLYLRDGARRQAALAALPIAATLIAGTCYFGSYVLLPYGTLALAPNHRYPMREVSVEIACPLGQAPAEATVTRDGAIIATEPILTPDAVADAIRAGCFRYNHDAPAFSSLTLTGLTLTESTDTAGYCVPVWNCAVLLDGRPTTLVIPALP